MKDEVLALIRELAAMLEPGATAVWEIVLRQQTVEGRIGVWGGGLLLLIGLALLVKGFWSTYDGEESFGYFIGAPFALVPGLLWFVFSLQQLMNPAYYAIMTLRGML